jgi:hypothetical protein
MFTGNVSVAAVETHETNDLVLEHFERIQHRLSNLVAKHLQQGRDPEEFVRTVIDCERVNLVTRVENARISKAKGDYAAAGVQLVRWETLTPEVQRRLRRWIRQGRVANAQHFSADPPIAPAVNAPQSTTSREIPDATQRTALFAWMGDVVLVTADSRRLRTKDVAMNPPEVRVGLGGSGDANLTRVVARFLLDDGPSGQSIRCLSYLALERACSFGQAIPHKGSKMTSEIFIPCSTVAAGGLAPLLDAMVDAFQDRVRTSAALALGMAGASPLPAPPAALPPMPGT